VGVISNTGPIFTVIITSVLKGTYIKVSDRWWILLSFLGVSIISGADFILGIIFVIKKEEN
jgi:drug/metabolite transporter (DMT)-like permease